MDFLIAIERPDLAYIPLLSSHLSFQLRYILYINIIIQSFLAKSGSKASFPLHCRWQQSKARARHFKLRYNAEIADNGSFLYNQGKPAFPKWKEPKKIRKRGYYFRAKIK